MVKELVNKFYTRFLLNIDILKQDEMFMLNIVATLN